MKNSALFGTVLVAAFLALGTLSGCGEITEDASKDAVIMAGGTGGAPVTGAGGSAVVTGTGGAFVQGSGGSAVVTGTGGAAVVTGTGGARVMGSGGSAAVPGVGGGAGGRPNAYDDCGSSSECPAAAVIGVGVCCAQQTAGGGLKHSCAAKVSDCFRDTDIYEVPCHSTGDFDASDCPAALFSSSKGTVECKVFLDQGPSKFCQYL